MRRLLLLLAALAPLLCAEDPAVTKMLDLFERLRTAENLKLAGKPAPQVDFQLTERDINDYLKYSLVAAPRPGLKSVTVKAFPNNYISTYTTIDFDAVEKWKSGTIPVLLKPVLSGTKSILLDVRINANNGAATYSVEKAYFQSIRIPALLVSKMIEIVAARQPERYDTSKPVPLPFGLRQVWTTGKVIAGRN